MIQKVNVTSPKAFNYLRSQLSLGSVFLSRNILKLPLEHGKVFAFVPKETSNEALFRFESGGLYVVDRTLLTNPIVVPVQNEGVPFIVSIIHEFLKLDICNCSIFEEPNAKPSDPIIINSGREYVSIKEEIFYFLNSDNNNVKEIEQVLMRSEAYYLLGVLGSLDYRINANFKPFERITAELIKMIVDNINSFFVSAYDHEGYLMWTMI